MVAVVVPVDLDGRGLPVPGVAPEHFVGDGLEQDVRRCFRAFFDFFTDRGKQGPGPVAGFVRTDGPGLTDDLPDPPAAVLTMYEVSLGT